MQFAPRLNLPRAELLGWVVLALAFLTLLVPTLLDLSRSVWQTEEQGHGPIIGAVCLWLLWRKREAILAAPYAPLNGWGSAVFALSCLLYAVGRSQDIAQFEVLALIGFVSGGLLLTKGAQAFWLCSFALFFLVFMVPLPGVLVQFITVPLKAAVSVVSEQLMYLMGYPIGRTGVILFVGPYQLLVADACAGLNSMFTLEALGLLYMNLMGYTSRFRNVLLAILIIPISFFANVVRVIILILVTYHFGDEAGQGFIHGFAGMVLFIVGLVMMLIVDGLLGRLFAKRIGASTS
jgi:exosortase B